MNILSISDPLSKIIWCSRVRSIGFRERVVSLASLLDVAGGRKKSLGQSVSLHVVLSKCEMNLLLRLKVILMGYATMGIFTVGCVRSNTVMVYDYHRELSIG